MAQDPWRAEPLGAGRFRFTNTSSGLLEMIELHPLGLSEIQVTVGGVEDNPHVVRYSIAPGDFFVAIVRGEGVRVTSSTAYPVLRTVIWTLEVS